MKMQKRQIVMTLLLAVLVSLSAQAQNDVLTSYNIFDIKTVVEVEISPDGSLIAFTRTAPRPWTDSPGGDYRELYIYNVASGDIVPVVTGKQNVYAPSWTPDGQKLAFRARLDTLGMQVHWFNVAEAKTERVTSHPTSVHRYTFHPQGSTLAYTAMEPADPETKALAELGFNMEFYEEEWRPVNLYFMDMNTSAVERITEEETLHELEWLPDGSVIAANVTQRNLIDDTYMYKRIHLLDVQTKQMPRYLNNPGKLGEIKWSPNGRYLAFISAVDVHDNKEQSIFVVDAQNHKTFGQLRNYSEGFEGSVVAIEWKNNDTFVFASHEGAECTLREQGVNDASSTLLLEPGKVAFSDFSIAGDMVALAGSTPEHPSEVYTFNLETKELQRRTNSNDWLGDVRLAKQEAVEYTASDGLKITGVLIYPLDYEKQMKETPDRTYPLITVIHGGPEASYQNGWLTWYSNWGQIAAAKDYFVFYPNYRSSTGRGPEFSRMGLGDLAGKEFDDVLDGINWLIEDKKYVDPDRVGIGGGSYGGYFSAWAATKHTNKFAASVVFVGVTNQISKRNTTDIPFEDYAVHWGIWTHENWEKVYDRSPVKHAVGSKTPTLILHGDSDTRVHPSQSLELYRVMERHGENPVRLIFYPGEGHGNRKNPARLDYSLRTMRWFEYYLKGQKKKKWEIPEKEIDYQLPVLELD
ncbi:MAG: peptidase S9 [Ectothiorhodospiraceae bacterium]|nr:peptidase S9 [Ectothiorhodospiraceae bacterium]